MIQKAIVTGII